MSAVPPPNDQKAATPAPAKKSLKNETWWKLKFIMADIFNHDKLKALAPNYLDKPFASDRWTIAPATIQYRNAQALAKKKTLGVNHRTALKVVMTGLLLIGGAASIFFTIHGLVGFSLLVGLSLLLLQLANKMYFLKDPPASRNPHYLEGESVELVTRAQGGQPADAQQERNRAQYEEAQKQAPAKQFPASSAPQIPTGQPQKGASAKQHKTSSLSPQLTALPQQSSTPPTTQKTGPKKPTQTTQSQTITESDNDIAKFTGGQLANYASILQQQHPEVFLPKHAIYEIPEPGPITIAGIRDTEKYSRQNIGHAVLRDMHLDDICTHQNQQQPCNKTLLAYPIYLRDHWALLVIDRTKRTVEYYDSGIDNQRAVTYLKELAEALSKFDYPGMQRYKFQSKVGHVQRDTKLCGPWMLYFLEERLNNREEALRTLNANTCQLMIREYRKQVLQKLSQLGYG